MENQFYSTCPVKHDKGPHYWHEIRYERNAYEGTIVLHRGTSPNIAKKTEKRQPHLAQYHFGRKSVVGSKDEVLDFFVAFPYHPMLSPILRHGSNKLRNKTVQSISDAITFLDPDPGKIGVREGDGTRLTRFLNRDIIIYGETLFRHTETSDRSQSVEIQVLETTDGFVGQIKMNNDKTSKKGNRLSPIISLVSQPVPECEQLTEFFLEADYTPFTPTLAVGDSEYKGKTTPKFQTSEEAAAEITKTQHMAVDAFCLAVASLKSPEGV